MSKQHKVVRLRPEDEPRYQNRKGPGGMDLDPTEAGSWFPDLDDAKVDSPSVVNAGDAVLVAYSGIRFWLHNVEKSVEPGFYFGYIAEWPSNAPECDERYAYLGPDQTIGFEPQHVFEVRRVLAAA